MSEIRLGCDHYSHVRTFLLTGKKIPGCSNLAVKILQNTVNSLTSWSINEDFAQIKTTNKTSLDTLWDILGSNTAKTCIQ